jgi:predicted ATPase
MPPLLSFASNVLGARGALLSALVNFFEKERWGSLAEMSAAGQSLTAEDQLFVLMQAGRCLIHTRGFAAPEARICYERAEALCYSLNRPLVLIFAFEGQWRYSLVTDKLTTTMQIARRAYSLAQEQNNSALMIRAYRTLAVTFCFLGDFETARRYAMRGVQIWRSVGVQSSVEEISTPEVICLCYEAIAEWHLGEISFSRANMAEAISLAKELNDMHGLAVVLWCAAALGHFERSHPEVERCASDLIELSTHQSFSLWLAGGEVFRGWARSASGSAAEGLSWIEKGIADWRANGSMWCVPYFLALKAETLHVVNRTSEALEAIREAEAVVQRSEERWWCAELQRLRGVFLAAISADETEIEASFCAAIRIAREQKSISLENRAEATYAEYRRQKASGSGGRGFRLPLW